MSLCLLGEFSYRANLKAVFLLRFSLEKAYHRILLILKNFIGWFLGWRRIYLMVPTAADELIIRKAVTTIKTWGYPSLYIDTVVVLLGGSSQILETDILHVSVMVRVLRPESLLQNSRRAWSGQILKTRITSFIT